MEDKNSTPELDKTTETASETKKEDKQPKSIGREIFEWAYSIVIAVLIAFLIKGFLFDIVRVDGSSMYPTLENNDRLIVTKLNYEPKNGDIIILDANYKIREVYFDSLAAEKNADELTGMEKFKERFSLPDECKKVYYVKRIIATEGQTVDIRGGKVYVDGNELSEEYINGQTFITDSAVKYPFTVSEGCVFVMGDNREHSSDSRVARVGEIPREAILGKSQLRVFPFNAIGKTE